MGVFSCFLCNALIHLSILAAATADGKQGSRDITDVTALIRIYLGSDVSMHPGLAALLKICSGGYRN